MQEVHLFKYQLIDMEDESVKAKGLCEQAISAWKARS